MQRAGWQNHPSQFPQTTIMDFIQYHLPHFIMLHPKAWSTQWWAQRAQWDLNTKKPVRLYCIFLCSISVTWKTWGMIKHNLSCVHKTEPPLCLAGKKKTCTLKNRDQLPFWVPMVKSTLEAKTREVQTLGPSPSSKHQVGDMALDGIDKRVIVDWAICVHLYFQNPQLRHYCDKQK